MDIYILISYTFILIFEFYNIFLLYALIVLKVESNFEKRKNQSKRAETSYFLYILY